MTKLGKFMKFIPEKKPPDYEILRGGKLRVIKPKKKSPALNKHQTSKKQYSSGQQPTYIQSVGQERIENDDDWSMFY